MTYSGSFGLPGSSDSSVSLMTNKKGEICMTNRVAAVFPHGTFCADTREMPLYLSTMEIVNTWNDCLIAGIPAVANAHLLSLMKYKGPYRMNEVKNAIRENRQSMIRLLERYQDQQMLEPGELHMLAEEYKKEGILCLKSDMNPEQALALFDKAYSIHEDLIALELMPHTDLRPIIDEARLIQMALTALDKDEEAHEYALIARDWWQIQVRACQKAEDLIFDNYYQDFLEENKELLESLDKTEADTP